MMKTKNRTILSVVLQTTIFAPPSKHFDQPDFQLYVTIFLGRPSVRSVPIIPFALVLTGVVILLFRIMTSNKPLRAPIVIVVSQIFAASAGALNPPSPFVDFVEITLFDLSDS